MLAVVTMLAGAALAASIAYTYDELGRVKTVTYDDGTTTTYSYDAAGNRTTVTTAPAGPSLPSVPTNLRTQPPNFSTGNFTVIWNASTGTVHHYTLNELVTFGIGQGNTTNYTITPPATSKALFKGGPEKILQYKVRACATADETQCSAWSAPTSITTCGGATCNN